MVDEAILAATIDRDQPEHGVQHLPSVAHEEEQQEQRQHEARGGAERAEERARAEGGERREQLLQARHRPLAQVIDRDADMGLEPEQQVLRGGEIGEVLDTGDLQPRDRGLHRRDERAGLRGERPADQRQRPDQHEEAGARQQSGREALATVQATCESLLQRVHEVGDHARPGEGREEGLDDAKQQPGEQRRHAESEHTAVE